MAKNMRKPFKLRSQGAPFKEVGAKKKAIKTPIAANKPSSLTGLTPDVNSVKNPSAVVSEVRNVAAPTLL